MLEAEGIEPPLGMDCILCDRRELAETHAGNLEQVMSMGALLAVPDHVNGCSSCSARSVQTYECMGFDNSTKPAM